MFANGNLTRGATLIVVMALSSGSAAMAEELTIKANASLGESGGLIGAEVRLFCDLENPVKGSVYELYYQVRVHTKKGDLGPILGTKESPTGKAFFVAQKTAEDKHVWFTENVDVTRGGLTGMTNFKPWGKVSAGGYYEMVLRVEPHVYDVAQKKYITPSKTSAVILVAEVNEHGKVVRLQPLADLLAWSGTEGRDPTKYLALFADVDEFATLDNRIEVAYAQVLSSKTATTDAKIAFLKSLPPFYGKEAYSLQLAIDEIEKGDDAKLKAALVARREELKKK